MKELVGYFKAVRDNKLRNSKFETFAAWWQDGQMVADAGMCERLRDPTHPITSQFLRVGMCPEQCQSSFSCSEDP